MNIQTILTLGALVILSLTSLRFNGAVMHKTTSEVENKVMLTAFSLADDLIEEIKVKAYDETTRPFPTNNPLTLTPVANLGKENSFYDDVDDYNNYTKYVSAPHAENYTISCKVDYVSQTNPDQVSSIQTFCKRAIVTVSSPYMRNPIKLSSIFTLK
ncbi:MAG: hypothetical protein ACM3O3_02955 [Syntrophothermus sp.]